MLVIGGVRNCVRTYRGVTQMQTHCRHKGEGVKKGPKTAYILKERPPMQAKDVSTSFLNDNVVKNGGSTQYTFSMNGPFEKVEKCSRSVEHIFGNKCPCSFWMYSIAAWLLPWWLSWLFHARLRLLPHQGEGKSWSKKPGGFIIAFFLQFCSKVYKIWNTYKSIHAMNFMAARVYTFHYGPGP